VTPARLQELMRRALALAEQGRGFVEPNPMVGCLVLDAAGEVVGEGFHQEFGGPHAEVVALDRAGRAAEGGTLVVTLEPCSHAGKTPPCVDRVVAAGIKSVVAAMTDPFPEVAGRGFATLKAAGIAVEVGLMEDEARALGAPYLCLLERQRPYLRAKWAMTADGRTAAVDGSSKWITGDLARAHAHRIRGMMDAVVVGSGTILADDPMLNARGEVRRKAVRVVIDSEARTPPRSQVVVTAGDWPTMIVVGDDAPDAATKTFEDARCEVVRMPLTDAGRVSLPALAAEMGRRRWTNVLVEGGAELLGSFLTDGLIDAVDLYLAPKLIGGRAALGPVGGVGLPDIASALPLIPGEPVRLGDDFHLPMTVRR
jgi:diaminohydroxyphosphoribosylaminopyrimidine deaminase/5-amino-6-(5-phosphoribosylamino)uracil reductase